MPPVRLGPLGTVNLLDEPSFLEHALTVIHDRRPTQVVTLNALMFNAALRSPALAAIIARSPLITVDSVGIVWAARTLSGTRITRCAGIDLMHSLCRQAGIRGLRVYLLGAAEGVAAAAAEKLTALYPALTIVGTRHGYFSGSEEATIIADIAAARPDLLFVGFSVPRQEQWISDHLHELGVPLVMGIGGSFDVISGGLKRAPRWMQSVGAEWLFRLLQQPSRIVRMTDLPVFVLNILKLKLARTA